MQLHKETVGVTIRSSRPTAILHFCAIIHRQLKYTTNNKYGTAEVQLILDAIIYSLQKPPRKPQGYQRYRTSGRGTIANQWKRKKKKQRRSTGMSMITTSQELHSPVQFL